MLKIDEEYARHQCVNAYHMRELEEQGWKLIAVIPSSHLVEATQDEPCPQPKDGNACPHGLYSGPCHGTQTSTVPLVTSEPLFLYGLGEERALASLARERDAAKEQQAVSESLVVTMQADLKEALKERDEYKEQWKELDARIRLGEKKAATNAKEASEAKRARHKMEGQLLKVREAIGTIKLQEILNA